LKIFDLQPATSKVSLGQLTISYIAVLQIAEALDKKSTSNNQATVHAQMHKFAERIAP
jgi:hypothetical protein